MKLLDFDLGKFVELLEDMLEELRVIRALLEARDGYDIVPDNTTWTGWEPEDD